MPIKPARWRKGKSACAYCSDRTATTSDHVVPDCLYSDEARQAVKNMLTVPACSICNAEKDQFDRWLQHYLLSDADVSGHPDAQLLFRTKVRPAAEGNHLTAIRRDNFNQGKIVSEITASGIWVRNLYEIPVDEAMLKGSLNYILRGLHFLAFSEARLAHDVRVAIVHRSKRDYARLGFEALKPDDSHTQGSAFRVGWKIGPTRIYWMLEFFGVVLCIGESVRSPSERAALNQTRRG